MKKILIRKYVMRACIFCFAMLGLASCTETPASPTQGGSVVAMRTQMNNSTVHSLAAGSVGASIDSLQVTQAVFAANNFMLRSDVSDEVTDPNLAEGFIHQGQFILAFDIGGIQYIGENIIYGATYRRARFEMQPIRPESLPSSGPYASLFEDEGVSSGNTIIMKGFVWKNGIQMPFTFSAATSGSGNIFFDPPLVVSAGGSPMQVMVHFDPTVAFSGRTGVLLDPRDGKNASEINTNIKAAMKAVLSSSGS